MFSNEFPEEIRINSLKCYVPRASSDDYDVGDAEMLT